MKGEDRLVPSDKICYIKPKHAIRRLKAADEENITAYIYGVSGIGKTELIIRYLNRRKYLMLDAGVLKREDLQIEKASQRKIVVIDNLHELAMEDDCEDIKEAILSLIEREDIWVILAGRCAIMPWLVATRYREVFYVIEENELLFDERQARQFLKQNGILFTPKQMKEEIEYCKGMPLAYNMTASVYWQMLSNKGITQPSEPFSDEEYQYMVNTTYNQMWDYLEYHVYDRWSIQLQEFLMEVSIVDEFSIHLAEMITGRRDIEVLLDKSKWIGNFMIEVYNGNEVIYKIREEMLVSMRRRLRRKYTKDKIRSLYENAGLFYQLSHQPLRALELYEKIKDTERIASILIDNIREAPNKGYYYELKKYYLALSEQKIFSSPELMCGMSMLQSLLLNIDESERWYRELEDYAKKHSGSQKRIAKSKLLYLDIELPHRGTEQMIEILKKAYLLLLDKQVSLQEFSVTSNQASQMNGGKDFCEWSKRDRELAKSIGKIVEFIFGKYGKGLVNLALAESFFEKGEDNYEVASLANKGRMQAEAGGKIEQCFVADGILAWLHVMTGKVSEAEELLTRFYKKAQNECAEKLLPNIETFIIRCALYSGDKVMIEKWMENAPDEEQEFSIYDRFHYMTKVRVYLLTGRNEQAYHLLLKCGYYAKVMKRTYIDIEVKLLTAIVMYRIGDKTWDEILSKALTKAQEYHFVRIVTREGAAIRPLLLETTWKPLELADDKEQTRKNKQFWKQVLEETQKMTRYYPSYLKAGQESVALSDTMIKILKLQADGLSKEKIATELSMSVSNVKYHTQQIYKKLGVSNKAEAVMEAGKRGLL